MKNFSGVSPRCTFPQEEVVEGPARCAVLCERPLLPVIFLVPGAAFFRHGAAVAVAESSTRYSMACKGSDGGVCVPVTQAWPSLFFSQACVCL